MLTDLEINEYIELVKDIKQGYYGREDLFRKFRLEKRMTEAQFRTLVGGHEKAKRN